MPNGKSNPSTTSGAQDDWAEIEQELSKTEIRLRDLKDRYGQIQRDLRMEKELREERSQYAAQPKSAAAQHELKKIDEELDQIELALESRLFRLDNAFWQAVRFGGLGVVLGWLLKTWAG